MVDINRLWYGNRLNLFLLPFAWLFRLGIIFRRWLYRQKFLLTYTLPVPVIVVGNISIGGTGKTPLTIWLANFLRARGYTPGIVSRGYGGKRKTTSYLVLNNSPVTEVGDEALLLARHTACPVLVNVDRVQAVRDLIQQTNCNIVIADDGLQHYRLGRFIEIAVVDGVRRFGNQQLLPAGPLREPLQRLDSVDFVVVNESFSETELGMKLEFKELISLKTQQRINIEKFTRQTIHAVAGIGNPQRFFSGLEQAGFKVIAHSFPDHHIFKAEDLDFQDQYPIIMTEKDAVKCVGLVDERAWYMTVEANIDEKFQQQLLLKLEHFQPSEKLTRSALQNAQELH